MRVESEYKEQGEEILKALQLFCMLSVVVTSIQACVKLKMIHKPRILLCGPGASTLT